MDDQNLDVASTLQQSHGASLVLAQTSSEQRNLVLRSMAEALKHQQNHILEANTLDLETSREMAVPEIITSWLKLTPERLQIVVKVLEQLAVIPDPIGRTTESIYPATHYQTYAPRVPLGVVAFIYEAFPELAAVAAGMNFKAGNSLILRGGSEASQSNAVITELLRSAIEAAGLPPDCVRLLPADQGSLVKDLVVQEEYLKLAIPHGRPNLVQQVLRQATVPVLPLAMGNCYLFWSASGSGEVTRNVILDSYQGGPDRVNAIEKVLLHQQLNPAMLMVLWNSLREKGFELRGSPELVAQFPDLKPAEASEWSQPYFKKTIAFHVVESAAAAVDWINTYSSRHADCLITDSYEESRLFSLKVYSAAVYINASPRFSRLAAGTRGSVALGLSNQRGIRGGVVGLETLTTVKHIIQGHTFN